MEIITKDVNNIDYSQTKKTNSNISSTSYDVNSIDQLTKFIDYTANDNRVEVDAPLLPNGEAYYDKSEIKNIRSSTQTPDYINPIYLLASQEPDFMPNMYNVYFILADRDTSADKIDMSKSIERVSNESGRNYLQTTTYYRWNMIGTRLDSIDIPQRKQSVATIKFAGNTINKLVNRYEKTNKIDLSVRLDQSMFLLDAFHGLAGDFWAAERERSNTLLNLDVFPDVKMKEGTIVGSTLYNMLGVISQVGHKMLDIVVEYDSDYFLYSRYHDLFGTVGYGDSSQKKIIPENPTAWSSNTKNRIHRYVFHNCHFLGRSSAISFSHDANPITSTFPFTFRKVVHLTAAAAN